MEKFPIYRKIFLYCKYSNSSNFGRKFLDFSKQENFPYSANVPIHLILLEKFPPSPIGLKIGTLTGRINKISEFSKKLVKGKKKKEKRKRKEKGKKKEKRKKKRQKKKKRKASVPKPLTPATGYQAPAPACIDGMVMDGRTDGWAGKVEKNHVF